MLAPTAKTKRFLETIQVVLTFAGVCAVVDASRLDAPRDARAGYHASVPQERDESSSRRIGDLARVDRKRREAEQLSNCRALELAQALEQRQRWT